jgi:hypothetical protein
VIRIGCLTLAWLIGSAAVALAQFPPQPAAPKCASGSQGTPQERAACQPDVTRFCQAELKANECDVFAILGCLQRNRARLGAPCRQVLTSNGQ